MSVRRDIAGPARTEIDDPNPETTGVIVAGLSPAGSTILQASAEARSKIAGQIGIIIVPPTSVIADKHLDQHGGRG